MSAARIHETELTLISENTKLEGQLLFSKVTRVHGLLSGEIRAEPGSTLILAQSSVVEGQIFADTLLINGFVRGNIEAKKSVVISESGRVIGTITSPHLKVESGAYLEGRLNIIADQGRAATI